ncbi:MAG TPA: glycogen debranching protein [Candidatus Limnocylindria bacterium]
MLARNHVGGWTKPAPRLYPHQWSWDAAFISIGLTHHDPDRALRELEHLFGAQWADGRVPHIVFDPRVPDYWPGPELWASAASSPLAPRAPATSGLIQPPMHAIAVWRILELGTASERFRDRVGRLYPKLVAWHRYLAEKRDPENSGLITVYHPWEGTDNTPRWDQALLRLEPGVLTAYTRTDTTLVGADERPSSAEYDRYLWLVGLLRELGYDDASIQRSHPFRIKDVQCSAIFAAACGSLERIAEVVGAPREERAEITEWRSRAADAVMRAWDDELGLALDFDLVSGEPIRVLTSAGLSILLVPGLRPDLAQRVRETAFGPDFAGGADLLFPVLLSTGLRSPEFRSRAYWRGPTWPVVNWLIWWGMVGQGMTRPAAALREANLGLLSRPGAKFAEYFEPFTGEPLGSIDQSWTAAVALDWLAAQPAEPVA